MLGGEEFLADDRDPSSERSSSITGPARLDRRTKHLVRRLGPDDIAIIDHADLDRVSAEELVESGVRVVVNVVAVADRGGFRTPGRSLLVRGGVRLIDAPGAELFDEVSDGELLTVRGGEPLPQRHVPRGRASRSTETELDGRARRAAEPRDRGARGVRRQHDALPARRGQAARRGDRLPAAADAVPRPPRARRRPRARAQARPADRAAVHPRLQAGARRRRRRRGRAARGRATSRT